MKKNFIISFLICFTVSIFGQGILSAPVVDKLSKAVYEVVVLKPGEGNIEYEKSRFTICFFIVCCRICTEEINNNDSSE